MADQPASSGGLLEELKRRRVLYAAGAYAVTAFAITDMASFVFENFGAPAWADRLLAALFVAGFPVAMFLSWVFDIERKGLVRSRWGQRNHRTIAGLALFLLVLATGGLFYLIFPSAQAPTAPAPPSPAHPAVSTNVLAVLPFANDSGDTNDDYLAEGLSNELRDQLGRVPGLNVKAQGSSIAVMQQTRDEQEIASRLSVGSLVLGSLQRQHDTIRISVRLVDGRTGYQIWSDSYDRASQDLLQVQQSIARIVVQQVLPEAELAAPATESESAHRLMLLARHYEERVRVADVVDEELLREAIGLYHQAIEADPGSALAHSRLAGALLYLGDVEAAEAPVFEALSLNPGISAVQYTLGLYLWRRGLPGIGVAYQRAIELDPNNAVALEAYAMYVWHWGDVGRGEELFQRALAADPLTFPRYRSYGFFLSWTGKEQQTLDLIERIRTLFPDNPTAYLRIARMYHKIGATDHAIAWALKARGLGSDEAASQVAEFYLRLGEPDTAYRFEPDPGLGLLYLDRRYAELVDLGEVLLYATNESEAGRLLAFAYLAQGRPGEAIRVARSVGQPRSARAENSDGNHYTGLIGLADALNASGQHAEAQSEARWLEEIMEQWLATGYHSAFPLTLSACAKSILGLDEEVLDRMDRMKQTLDLPLMPIFLDAPCFQRFAGHPVYQSVIDHVEQRRSDLLRKLPITLDFYRVPHSP